MLQPTERVDTGSSRTPSPEELKNHHKEDTLLWWIPGDPLPPSEP